MEEKYKHLNEYITIVKQAFCRYIKNNDTKQIYIYEFNNSFKNKLEPSNEVFLDLINLIVETGNFTKIKLYNDVNKYISFHKLSINSRFHVNQIKNDKMLIEFMRVNFKPYNFVCTPITNFINIWETVRGAKFYFGIINKLKIMFKTQDIVNAVCQHNQMFR